MLNRKFALLVVLMLSLLGVFPLAASACDKTELEARFHVGTHDAMATLLRFFLHVTPGWKDPAHSLKSMILTIDREEQNEGKLLERKYGHIPYVREYLLGQGTDEK